MVVSLRAARGGTHGGSDPVRGEDERGPRRNLGHRVDEHRPACLQVADDVGVVDDLLADEDRFAIEPERPLHRLHCPLDTRAIASRGGEEDPFHHFAVTIAAICEIAVKERRETGFPPRMEKPAARGVGAAGSPKLLTAVR